MVFFLNSRKPCSLVMQLAVLVALAITSQPLSGQEAAKPKSIHVVGGGPLHISDASFGILSLTGKQLTTAGNEFLGPVRKRPFVAKKTTSDSATK